MDWATEVLPTPGGPAKSRIGLRRTASRARVGEGAVLRVLVVSAASTTSGSTSTLGRFLLFAQLEEPDGEELEDPVLDVAETVVVLLEDFARLGDVEALVGVLVPRQLADGLEIGADDLGLHAFRAHPLEA